MCKLTDPVDHVDAVVETLHQLALTLRGRLYKQLAGRDKLPRLGGQQLLGTQESCLAPVLALPSQAQHLAFPQVLCHMCHYLLCLLENNQPACRFQGLVVLGVRLINAGALQAVILVKVRVGIDVLGVAIVKAVGVVVGVAVGGAVAILFPYCVGAVMGPKAIGDPINPWLW